MSKFVEYTEAGFGGEIIPIIPPGAKLSEKSSVDPSQTGKIPGLYKRGQQCWIGFPDWATRNLSINDAKVWDRWGVDCGVGIRTAKFPFVDVDCTIVTLNTLFEALAKRILNPDIAKRYRSNSPRLGFLYRLAPGQAPLPKQRIAFTHPETGDTLHAVEVLCRGQQFVAEGIHPSGVPYEWDFMTPSDRGADAIPVVNSTQLADFAERIKEIVEQNGGTVVKATFGDAIEQERHEIGDKSLVAADTDELARALKTIPNDMGYDDWITLMCAVKAATAGDETFYSEHFAPWSMQHPECDPEFMRVRWDSIRDASIGADFIYRQARHNGFEGGPTGFEEADELPETPVEEQEAEDAMKDSAAPHSDVWFSDKFIVMHGDVFKYSPSAKKGEGWKHWDGAYWKPCAESREARELSKAIIRQQSKIVGRDNITTGRAIGNKKPEPILHLAETSDKVWVDADKWDKDEFVINTPGGLYDLRNGKMLAPDPATLVSKITTIAPDFKMLTPKFNAFIKEALGYDEDYIHWLQKCVGYMLTGSTIEQVLFVFYGKTKTGKSTFLSLIEQLLGTYVKTIDVKNFVWSPNERHPQELAGIQGYRIVTCGELADTQYFNGPLLKSLTGADTISAHYMGENSFTFRPNAKFALATNHMPKLHAADEALNRRLLMPTFDNQPKAVNLRLKEEIIKEEGPGVLAWMIQGALWWMLEGLGGIEGAPKLVRETAEKYFRSQDHFGNFISRVLVQDVTENVSTDEVWYAYQKWANEEKERMKHRRDMVKGLQEKGMREERLPTKRDGFYGWKLAPAFESIGVS